MIRETPADSLGEGSQLVFGRTMSFVFHHAEIYSTPARRNAPAFSYPPSPCACAPSAGAALVGLEGGSRQTGLADDRLEGPQPELGVIRDRDGDRRGSSSLLQDDVASSPADLDKPMLRKNPAGFPAGHHSQLTQP